MITLLAIIPWVLTVGALLFIMVRGTEEYEDELIDEDEEETEYTPSTIRVAVYQDKAYWVYNNVLYESETTKEPAFETARPVDVMSLPKKDVTKLFVLLDELQEEGEGD